MDKMSIGVSNIICSREYAGTGKPLGQKKKDKKRNINISRRESFHATEYKKEEKIAYRTGEY